MNPANADIKGAAFSFIGQSVVVKSSAPTLTVIGEPVNNNGVLTFTVQAPSDLPALANEPKSANLVALQAITEDGKRTITSDYAAVSKMNLEHLYLLNAQKRAQETPAYDTLKYVTLDEAKKAKSAEYTLPCNETLNLAKLVELWGIEKDALLSKGHNIEEAGFAVAYAYERVKTEGSDGTTDQSQFINLVDGVVSINPEYGGTNGSSAVGKEPVIKVTSTLANNAMPITRYIKIQITAASEEGDTEQKELVFGFGDIPYTELTASGEKPDVAGAPLRSISWEQAHSIYTAVGLDESSFNSIYETTAIKAVDESGKAISGVTAFVNNYADQGSGSGTSTIALGLKISTAAKIGAQTAIMKFVPKDEFKNVYPVVAVKFTYNITEPEPIANFNPQTHFSNLVTKATSTAVVKGQEVGTEGSETWKLQVALKDLFTFDVPKSNYTMYFKLKDGQTDPDAVAISGTGFKDQVISLSKELEGTSKSYVVELYAKRASDEEKLVTSFTVEFTTPFVINVNQTSINVAQLGGATTYDARQLVSIVENATNGGAVYQYQSKDGNFTKLLTDLGSNSYHLSEPNVSGSATTIEYSIKSDKLPESTLSISKDGSELKLNAGAQLTEDTPATLTVKLTINDIVVLTKSETITLKK